MIVHDNVIITNWELNNHYAGIIAFTRNGTRLRELGGWTRRGGSQGRGAARGEGRRHVEQRSPYATKFRSPLRARRSRLLTDYSIVPGLNLPASPESSNAITRGGNCENGSKSGLSL